MATELTDVDIAIRDGDRSAFAAILDEHRRVSLILGRSPPASRPGLYPWRMARRRPPDVAPVLSRGKHRSPRKGACFMEYASWLAGEPWSDQPRCTHPLLAGVARMVNDHTSDAARSRLVALVPSVIGLHDDDPRIDARIAIRCATAAIRVVAEHRQRALAVSLLTAQKVLHDLDGGRLSTDDAHLLDQVHLALAAVPHAAKWAAKFTARGETTVDAFRQRGAPAAVRVSVTGIAEAAISDPEDLLYDLLVTVVHDFNEWLAAKPVEAATREPRPVDVTV